MASVIPTLPNQFLDDNGDPLAGGKVYTYEVGTTTPKTTWSDADETTPNANPLILDAGGRAIIYWNGSYKVVVHDSDDTLITSMPNVSPLDTLRTDLADSSDASKGDALVAVKRSETNAIATTQHIINQARHIYVTADYGAYGDGSNDDRGAFATADAAAGSTKSIYVPPGSYRIGSNVTLNGNYWFSAGAKLKPDAGVTVTINGSVVAGDYQIFDLTNAASSIVGPKKSSPINVTWFGAIGDGVTNCTSAFQNAINANAGPVNVFIPAGIYLITSTVLISIDRVMIYGCGVASQINFVPTADDVCFEFDKGSGAIYSVVQCTIKDFALYSSDTTYSKTALRLVDISELICDNVQTVSPHWRGGSSGSTFAHILSRDTSSFKNLNVFADRPIRISPDPDASIIGIDHFNFHNLYIGNVFGSAYPLIEIDDGVVVTQLTFTGYQAWVGGAGGFKWTDTTTAASSNQLTFENVRYESNNDPNNKYMIEINRSGAAGNLQNLSIVNGQTNLTKGIYLRRVLNASFENFWYSDSTREALNADSSVYPITTKNCFWQNGGTATLTGLELSSAEANYVSGPVRENGIYVPSGTAVAQVENNATFSSSGISLAIDAVAKIGGPTQLGMVFISASTGSGANAIFSFNGSSATVSMIADPDTAFSTTKNTSAKINVYWDAGNNRYEIQNKLAGAITVYVQRMGRS